MDQWSWFLVSQIAEDLVLRFGSENGRNFGFWFCGWPGFGGLVSGWIAGDLFFVFG